MHYTHTDNTHSHSHTGMAQIVSSVHVQLLFHVLSCTLFRTSFGSLATGGGQTFVQGGFGGIGTNQGIGAGTGTGM